MLRTLKLESALYRTDGRPGADLSVDVFFVLNLDPLTLHCPCSSLLYPYFLPLLVAFARCLGYVHFPFPRLDFIADP